MDLTTIRTETREITKTSTATLSDTTLDRWANIVYAKLVMEMVQASGHENDCGHWIYYDFKAEDGLVAGDIGYMGEYPFPADCLTITRVEVKYDQNLAPVTLYSSTDNPNSEFEKFGESFSPASPQMRFFRNSILIRPLPATTVSQGIYIEYLKRQDDLVNTSDVAIFESNFHDLIPLGVARRYYMKNPDKRNQDVIEEYKDQLEDFRVWCRDRFNKPMKLIAKTERW